jgi:ribosomal protein L19E
MRKLAILSALALAASLGSANARMGGMNQSQGDGTMNQQGTQGGMANKRMSRKQMMMRKNQMMRRNNVGCM